MKAQLVIPDIKYQESYLEAIKEYQAEDLPNYRNFKIEELKKDFSTHVEKIKSEASGENLPKGYVPHTLLWLVDDQGYIGRMDIRHQLNEYLETIGGHIGYDIRPSRRRQGLGKLILKLGLEKAKELGIDNIVITCDVDNVGSRKIIEANGGQFIDHTRDEDGVQKKRFQISLD